ncbi:MAG TPA: hypothetical protein VFX59_28645 [Polyangiales bacterium]|nr:hypothetical protein [Polyangiales bacterium]
MAPTSSAERSRCRDEAKRVRAMLMARATEVYEAPVRITESLGAVEVRVTGQLMCAAYSMRGRACEMLLALLQ